MRPPRFIPTQKGSYILGLMLTAQAIERIADHAVNIAEDVVYMVEGADVRHMRAEELEDLEKESVKISTSQSKARKRNNKKRNRKNS